VVLVIGRRGRQLGQYKLTGHLGENDKVGGVSEGKVARGKEDGRDGSFELCCWLSKSSAWVLPHGRPRERHPRVTPVLIFVNFIVAPNHRSKGKYVRLLGPRS
jgi:hypothetical protein